MTLRDARPEILEALNDVGEQYGVDTGVADRVGLARTLAAIPVGGLSAQSVIAAMAHRGLRRPPAGYASALIRRIAALGPSRTLLDELLSYRRHAIDVLSREFGGKTKAQEDRLRNNLRTYLAPLVPETQAESLTGRGKTDIFIPSLNALIEVKVWSNRSTYDEGVEELGRYIHSSGPSSAYMVVFGDREPLPSIASSHSDAIADVLTLEGLKVPVILVPFEVDAPSKALRAAKSRSSRGRGSTPTSTVD